MGFFFANKRGNRYDEGRCFYVYVAVMSPLLSLVLEKLQTQTILAPFLILHGTGADRQWEQVRTSCQSACGFFAHQDVLELKDYSHILQKSHTIKVHYNKTDDTELLRKEQGYEDK